MINIHTDLLTGANIVDQDFFEALDYRHYVGDPFADDEVLRQQRIDRIYDTYIDEDQLRVCDMTIAEIAEGLDKRPYSSREFIQEMGAFEDNHLCLECGNAPIARTDIFGSANFPSNAVAGRRLLITRSMRCSTDSSINIPPIFCILCKYRRSLASDQHLLQI